MRSFTLPVVAAALALIPADRVLAQNGIRFAASNGSAKSRQATTAPKTRLTAQVTTDGGIIIGNTPTEGSDGYVAGGYNPADSHAGITAGCAFGIAGAYGYNPDFGVGPNGMSVWPGVPACCDPWLGYCGEPRCFNACNCGKGTFQYYHCPPGACSPDLLTWQKGDWAENCCYRRAGMCYGANGCGNSTCGGTCRPASYVPTGTEADGGSPAVDAPSVQPTPAEKAMPPRNEIPKASSGKSARRRVSHENR